MSLADVRGNTALLKTIGGEQHLFLAGSSRVAQLRCLGDDLRSESFMLEIVVDRFPDVDAHQRIIQPLSKFFRDRGSDWRSDDWSVEATRHRDALVALDLRRDGGSYRDIAMVLYGEASVRGDWSNPNQTMKNRVVRSVKRGVRLMKGGYRALLS